MCFNDPSTDDSPQPPRKVPFWKRRKRAAQQAQVDTANEVASSTPLTSPPPPPAPVPVPGPVPTVSVTPAKETTSTSRARSRGGYGGGGSSGGNGGHGDGGGGVVGGGTCSTLYYEDNIH